MGLGSISGSFSPAVCTMQHGVEGQRPEGSTLGSKDVFERGESQGFVQEQQFAKAGRLFQSCAQEMQQTNKMMAASEVELESVNMYPDRNGYDENFLGKELPLPTLGDSVKDQVAMRTDKPNESELTYTNYSVVMNKDRRQCFYAICNIDGSSLSRPKRSGGWSIDGRIAREHQLGNEAYKGNNIDKGHMVRRLDPCWGDNPELASRDTFSYCNAALQHGGLNQKEWLQLEDHVLGSSKGQKMTVITGPIFREDDPWFDNNGKMQEPEQIPLSFFKTVVWADDNGDLKSASFILDQEDIIKGDGQLGIQSRGFDPGRFEMYQVPQSEVEELTDLHFGDIGDITESRIQLNEDNNFTPQGL